MRASSCAPSYLYLFVAKTTPTLIWLWIYYWNLLYYDDAISFNVVWLQCRVLKYEVVVELSTSFNCCSTCFSLLRAIHSVSGLCQLLFLSRGFLSAYFVLFGALNGKDIRFFLPSFAKFVSSGLSSFIKDHGHKEMNECNLG